MLALARRIAEEPTVWGLVGRVVLAAALGGLLGVEREARGQPAGFRTHILVAVGSALFTLTGVVAAAGSGAIDPTRVAAQVVTGIGFLGAGAIIHQGISIRGLTTAATLWVTASIGTAVGIGYVEGALVATVVTVLSLVVFKRLERRVLTNWLRPERDLALGVSPDFRLPDVMRAIQDHGGRVLATRLDEDDGRIVVTATIRLARTASYDDLVPALLAIPGVHDAGWNR